MVSRKMPNQMPANQPSSETPNQRRHRELLFALLIAYLIGQRSKLAAIVGILTTDGIPLDAFSKIILAILRSSHAYAAMYGRRLTGDDAPLNDEDWAYADLVMEGQREFFDNFIKQLRDRDPRYVGTSQVDGSPLYKLKPIMSRLDLYLRRTVGTANEVFVSASPDDALFWWVLGENEDHCSDCPDLAAGSPYTKESLPTVPGAAETICQLGCLCSVVREDGATTLDPRIDIS